MQSVHGLSFDIVQGEFACQIGSRVSSKTTLLNIIGGLDEPGRYQPPEFADGLNEPVKYQAPKFAGGFSCPQILTRWCVRSGDIVAMERQPPSKNQDFSSLSA